MELKYTFFFVCVQFGCTALHRIAAAGRLVAVKTLLEKSVTGVNATDIVSPLK